MPTLTVTFDKADVEVINNAKQQVIIVQEVLGASDQVIWAAFSPFESNNIQWSSEYYLYASSTQIENYNIIHGISTCEATPDSYYQFDNTLTFEQLPSSEESNEEQYKVINNVDYDKYALLTFGLAQNISVNSQPSIAPIPLSATAVLAKTQANFSPEQKITIYLAANLLPGMIYNHQQFPQLAYLPLSTLPLVKQPKITRRQWLKLSTLALSSIAPNIALAESIALTVDFQQNKDITVKYFGSIGKFVEMSE